MSFEPIKTGRNVSERTEADRVYVAVYGNREEGKPRHLAIRIGKEVAEKLGWTVGTKIAVMEGFGRDAGVLKLVPGDAGNTAMATNPKRPNGAIVVQPQVSAFQHHDFPTLQTAEPVSVQAFGREMLVKLPDWAIYKAEPETEPEPAQPQQKAQDRGTGQPQRRSRGRPRKEEAARRAA